jgi:excisionase family DNA binding protein
MLDFVESLPNDSSMAGTEQKNRLDPSDLGQPEIERLLFVLSQPRNAMLIDSEGKERTEIPPALYKHLVRVVQMMKERRAIVMIPEDEAFTTQAAANFLGMSRQSFVNLIESGKIPFFTVGSHRRVFYKDLLGFRVQRDAKRREALNELNKEVEEAGLYFPSESQDERR